MRGSIVSREMIIWIIMHEWWNEQASTKRIAKDEMNTTKTIKQIAKEQISKTMQIH